MAICTGFTQIRELVESHRGTETKAQLLEKEGSRKPPLGKRFVSSEFWGINLLPPRLDVRWESAEERGGF